MFEEIFKWKKLNEQKLADFGFVREGNLYRYTQEVLNHGFTIYVTIGADSLPTLKLIENENGEEYILYKTNAQGSFVGAVREEIQCVLKQIAETCYETEIFHTRQAKMLIGFVRKTYGDEPEYLWKKFPDNAVWRRKDSQKWYGAILTVSGRKIGLDTDQRTEIIDLRLQPEHMAALLKQEGYYHGWHMNKKSWYTIILNDSIPDGELLRRLCDSYGLAKK